MKDTPNLPAGPVDLKFRVEKKSAYTGPYCATVTMNAYELKADKAEGFWYWGGFQASTLTASDQIVSNTSYEIKKFDGSTPLGTYGSTGGKAFPVNSAVGGVKFKVVYSPAYLWALNDCAGCIGMENLSYKEYAFPSVTDGVEYECGFNYDLYLYNQLKP